MGVLKNSGGGRMAVLRGVLNGDVSKNAPVDLKIVPHRTASTGPNGKGGYTVYLPSSLDPTDSENWVILLGMTVHEDGHHLYTDFDQYAKASKSRFGGLHTNVLNAFDDIHQERRKRAHRIGDHAILDDMYTLLIKRGFYELADDGLGLAIQAVFFGGHLHTNQYAAFSQIARTQAEKLIALAGKGMANKVLSFIPRTAQVNSSADAYHLAEELLMLLTEAPEDNAPPPPPPEQGQENESSPEDDSQTNNSPSEDPDDNSGGNAFSSEDDDHQEESGDEPGGESSNDSSDPDEDAGEEEGNGDTVSENRDDVGGDEESTGGNPADETTPPSSNDSLPGSDDDDSTLSGNQQSDFIKSINQSLEDDALDSLDAMNVINEFIQEQCEKNLCSDEPVLMPAHGVQFSPIYQDGLGDFDEVEARRSMSGLASGLRKLLASQAKTKRVHRSSGSRINSSRLGAVTMGATDVFISRKTQVGSNTAVSIVVDCSISMDDPFDYPSAQTEYPHRVSRMKVANECAYALSRAIQSHKGNETEVIYFSGRPYMAKKFGQRLSQNDCFRQQVIGGTNLANALHPAILSLIAQPQPRKVMLIVTDGETSDATQAAALIRGANKLGIDVYGLGIGATEYLSPYLPATNIVGVNSPAELRQKMFELSKKAITSPPRG